jgi:site-specific DNA-methyltransferase (adenine-specific)
VYGDYGAVTTHQTESQKLGRFPANTILDNQDGEEWRRYFYCAKASKKDRDEGLEEDTTDDGRKKPIDNPYLRGGTMRHNTHPTVKPTTLMQYLVRLVTPRGGDCA